MDSTNYYALRDQLPRPSLQLRNYKHHDRDEVATPSNNTFWTLRRFAECYDLYIQAGQPIIHATQAQRTQFGR
jgi:hypothetical protein